MKPQTLISPDLSHHITPPVPTAAMWEGAGDPTLVVTAKVAGELGNTIYLHLLDTESEDAEVGVEIELDSSHLVNRVILVQASSVVHAMQDVADALIALEGLGLVNVSYDEAADPVPFAPSLAQLSGGVDGITLTKGQAVFDEDFLYFAVNDTTRSDSSGLRKVALLAFVEA